MSDIVDIEALRDRAQAAYDKLPLSGPVTSWCEMYGEDLLDSCTKLLAALKQRTELIDAAAGHWLESCRVTSPPIPWEGAIDGAMEAACKEVKRLRTRVAELEAAQEWSPIESAPKTPNDSAIAVELLGWCPDETSPIGGDRRTIWWEPRLRGGCWYSDRDLVEHPTMWTDLPAPPKEGT